MASKRTSGAVGMAMGAPLEIRPRIYMRGGHRLDRVKEREILVNGQSLVRDSQIRSFVIEDAGLYEVTAKLYSTMGREESVTQTIEVVPNKPPECAPTTDDRFGYLIIEANCEDKDGKIEEIRWEMAGEKLPSSSYKYRFTEDQVEEMGGRVKVDVSAKERVFLSLCKRSFGRRLSASRSTHDRSKTH